ncbi:MAG: RNA-guided endonuclease TnpB family protein, partial [Clostridiales bacterium]|nr:RNA-guided endonuclease TnpB family protein [Clostridiales bacterium]
MPGPKIMPGRGFLPYYNQSRKQTGIKVPGKKGAAMRTITNFIKQNSDNCPRQVFYQNTRGSRAMRNTANFYIRNTMTGIKKSPEERTHNETEVLHYVFTGIQAANIRKQQNLQKKLARFEKEGKMGDKELVRKAYEKAEPFPYPTAAKWMLSYEQLDAIFRCTKNPVYYSMTSQVNQQAIRKATDSWQSYFATMADWKVNPGKYKAKPKMPGYIRTDETTAHLTKQIARPEIRREDGKDILYLVVTNYGDYRVGDASFLPGKLVKTEIKPAYGGYKLMLTYEDGLKEPEVPEDPKQLLAIDTGVSNFLACAANFKSIPFIIDGHWLKSMNQWFNKERARLMSELTKGKDSTESEKHSKRLDALSRRRDHLLREFFYKAAHYIMRWCKKHNVDLIVVGHNEGQKQDVNLGRENDQNFVSIPVCRMISILHTVSMQYQIPVVEHEESYTSKASLLDMDEIPVYGKEGDKTLKFSGKRVKRGLYRSADDTALNADINAAGNIGRKAYPDAYAGKDFHFLAETVEVVRREEFSHAMKKHDNIKGYKRRNSTASLLRHEARKK